MLTLQSSGPQTIVESLVRRSIGGFLDLRTASLHGRTEMAPMLELLDFEPAAAPYDYSSLLPGAERQALRLVLLEDRTYREVASLLDVSEGEIQTRLLRARQCLRAVDETSTID